MAQKANREADRARVVRGEEISALLRDAREEVLVALLDNPDLAETQVCLLLERKDLPGTLLEAIARRKEWMASYRVKRGVAFHVHAPRLLALRLARELYVMDLVQLSLQAGMTAELKRAAEELILARLPQLPLGQKITLARRGSARVVGGLLVEGHPQIVRVALDNGFLTEAQVLRALARENLPAPVVSAIAHHPKWSHLSNVRVALVRHPLAPLGRVLAFLPELTLRDLQELRKLGTLSGNLRQYIRRELARRSGGGSLASQRRA